MKRYHHFLPHQSIHHLPHKITFFNQLTGDLTARFYLYGEREKKGRKRIEDEEYNMLVADPKIHIRTLERPFVYAFTLIKLLYGKQNVVILHSYSDLFFLVVNIMPFKQSKIKWIVWGSGLNMPKKLTSKIKFLHRRFAYKQLDQIACLMYPDANDLVERFGYKNKLDVIPYYQRFFLGQADAEHISRKESSKQIRILVGNSGHKHNQHLKVFEYLRRFQNEDIEVYCFLNYGDDGDYMKSVYDQGKEIFGDKFFAYQELLSKVEYIEFIKGVHVLIMYAFKQTGLSAIYNTIKGGGVVYLNKEGKNKQWMEYLKVKTGNIEDIPQVVKAGDLNFLTVEERLTNFKNRNEFFHPEIVRQKWKSFLTGQSS